MILVINKGLPQFKLPKTRIGSYQKMEKIIDTHINDQPGDQTFSLHIRDIIRKVRKRQHQYPEFGHTQGEIKKKPAKKYISIQGGLKLRKPSEIFDGFLSFTVSLFFRDRLHCCYIDFRCSYLYSYYNSSRPLCIKCPDSAFRTKFQQFILRFNKISLLY